MCTMHYQNQGGGVLRRGFDRVASTSQLFCAPGLFAGKSFPSGENLWPPDCDCEADWPCVGHCDLCGNALPCAPHGNAFRDTPGAYRDHEPERRERVVQLEYHEAERAEREA